MKSLEIEILTFLSKSYPQDFVLLRDLDKLLEHKSIHDVDCFLDRKFFTQAVQKVSKEFGLQSLITISKRNFSSVIFVDDDWFTKFDFDHTFCWRGMPYLANQSVKQNVYSEESITVLNPSISYFQRVAKDLLGAGKVPTKKQIELRDVHRQICSEGLNVSEEASTVQFILSLQPDEIFEAPDKARLRLIKFMRADLSFRSVTGVLFYISDVARKFTTPTGKLVVLMGPDGAGKSSISQMLSEDFADSVFSGYVGYYSRPNLIPNLRKLILGTKPKSAAIDEPDNPGRVETPIRGSLKIIYYGFDFLLFRFRLLLHKSRNRLIVFDRYYYDYYTQHFWGAVPSWLKKSVERFVPEPDLVIKLEAPPEVIFARKPELSIEVIAHQYKQIDSLDLSNLVSVDTSSGVDVSKSQLIDGMIRSWNPK